MKKNSSKLIWQVSLLTFFLVILFLIYFYIIRPYFTLDLLKKYHVLLKGYVQAHFFLSSLFFMSIYFLAVVLSLPLGFFLCLCGGYFFCFPLSAGYILFSETIASYFVFSLARTIFRTFLRKKSGSLLEKMEKVCCGHAPFYLLGLRFINMFPFWFLNIGPALLGVRTKTFFWTTCFGIIPGIVILTHTGQSLSSLLESQETLSLSNIVTTEIKISFALLALLALSPIFIKKIMKKRIKKVDQ